MKLACLLLTCTSLTLAQDPRFYRLDFSVKELEETKVLSTKKYTTFMAADPKQNRGASIRAGSKVPYQTSPTMTNYADVGVNIDCNELRESGGQLVLHVNAEISSVPASEGAITATPLIRQNRWSSTVTLDPAKAVTLFSSDDLNSKRKLQLELIATPVK